MEMFPEKSKSASAGINNWLKCILAFFLCAGISIYFILGPFPSKRPFFNIPIAEKVLICGIGRNIESAVENTIQSAEKLGECFLDYRVIIYENNSTDGTKKLLRQWAKKNRKVVLLSEYVRKKQLVHDFAMKRLNRTEAIARARNQVLDVAMSPKFDDYKYIIWADLDFARPWDVEQVVETILHPEHEWDAVLAYGQYDLFAFRDERCPIGYELIGLSYWDHLDRVAKEFVIDPEGPWRKVYSAFGGLGIYRRSSIQGCRYCGVITPELETLLARWLEKARESGGEIPFLKEYEAALEESEKVDLTDSYLVDRDNYPKQLGLRLLNEHGKGKVTYFSCSPGTTLPWTCEHLPFHAAMISRGHDKIFVNPKIRSSP